MKARTQDDYIRTALRVPPDLHARIHESAKASGRTFNAEIVARLEASFERAKSIEDPSTWDEMAVLLRTRRAAIQVLIGQVEDEMASEDFDQAAMAGFQAELEDLQQLSDRIRQALVFIVKAKYQGDADIPEDLLRLADDLVKMPI